MRTKYSIKIKWNKIFRDEIEKKIQQENDKEKKIKIMVTKYDTWKTLKDKIEKNI
jgi:sRNA-binding carbon storage regulator CsrA